MLGLPWKPTLAAAGVSYDNDIFYASGLTSRISFLACPRIKRDLLDSRLPTRRVSINRHTLRSRFSDAVPKASAIIRARRKASRVLTLTW